MIREQKINQVAILGAGVMGAQIAAHCINLKVPVILFDLAKQSADGKSNPNEIVEKSIAQLKKLKPSPLCLEDDASLIQVANYDQDLELLKDCDLIIEAIAERLDWKHQLYEKVSPFISATAIFASNTSGISITELSKGFSDDLKERFCGVHFFNPPRYMHLLELIPTAQTNPVIVDRLETFMTSVLGKGVIRAKDTPNFVGNRVGVFSILAIFKEAEKFNLSFDEVDALTGSNLGRAKSATFRTSDVVGIDTMAHVIKTMENGLPNDPFRNLFKMPKVVEYLLEQGSFGQKSGRGFYQKIGREIHVLDFPTKSYVLSQGKMTPLVERILKKPIGERLELLRSTDEPQAKFLWAIYRDIFHYIALHLGDISQSAREIDFAIKWGYGWKKGPFEDWQEAGWLKVANWIKEDIDNGETLCDAPLPEWVFNSDVAKQEAIHSPAGSWSALNSQYVPKSNLPVYQKQIYRDTLFGEQAIDPKTAGKTIWENSEVRAWIDEPNSEVLICSFKSKMNTISPIVLEGIQESITLAENQYQGLVIWQTSSLKLGAPGGPFSAGANLEAALPMVMKSGVNGIEPFVKMFQDTMMKVKYATVPVVSAVSGIALGGGCELVLQSAKRVAAVESYIGLVEVGVGLLPAGGGLKEAAIRAHNMVKANGNNNYLDALKFSFENAAMAKVSGSAQEAVKMNYLKSDDIIVANVFELLSQAKNQVKALAFADYRPPIPHLISVGGRSVAATIMGQVINLRDGGFASEHDALIAGKIASVMTGGDVDMGTLVSEEWLLKLERQAFVELMGHPKTMERIMSLLQTGKPLRN